MPKVFIIILNWNGKDDTLTCLDSVQKLNYPNYHVIVVDNGSTDGSADAIRGRYSSVSWLTMIENGSNLGYTGGNNVGIRHARPERGGLRAEPFGSDWRGLVSAGIALGLGDDAIDDMTLPVLSDAVAAWMNALTASQLAGMERTARMMGANRGRP